MKVKWLLGKDVFRENIELFAEEIQRQGMEYRYIEYVPFSDDFSFEGYAPEDCVVFYGSIGQANQIRHKAKWIPGIFYSKKAYDCRNYYPALGKHILNKNYMMIPYGDLSRQRDFIFEKLGVDNTVFIRPDYGGKSFTGTLAYLETFDKFLEVVGYGQLDPETLLVVAEPKNIKNEWRFLVVEDNVVTGSQYRSEHGIKYDANYPQEAYAVAEIAAKLYHPDKAWVVDICETKNGDFHILEIGSFSCAGLYLCDREKVIREVSRVAYEEWKEYQ